MPKYVFECQNDACNCRFDRVLKMGEHSMHLCPSCGEEAPRCLEGEGFSFGFKVTVKEGEGGNTGVHKEDYPTADFAVGRSAENRWNVMNDRKKLKDGVRGQGGGHALIRRDGADFIEYEAMSPSKLEGRKAVAAKTFAAIREAKERRAGTR